MAESLANEVRQFVEKQDESLIDVLLAGAGMEDAMFDLKQIYCPLCKGETIQIVETSEGESNRTFFQIKCLDCGCEFVLFEDLIDASRRGIENAKKDIEYNKKKIEYFENKLKED